MKNSGLVHPIFFKWQGVEVNSGVYISGDSAKECEENDNVPDEVITNHLVSAFKRLCKEINDISEEEE